MLGGTGALGRMPVVMIACLYVQQVRDAAFLHRYNEPVLLVLHEPVPTWAGAARERRDTAALVALSLNVQQRRHTRLWAAEALPADALRLEASPAGGALVLCQSLILYYMQARSSALLHTVLPPVHGQASCIYSNVQGESWALVAGLGICPYRLLKRTHRQAHFGVVNRAGRLMCACGGTERVCWRPARALSLQCDGGAALGADDQACAAVRDQCPAGAR